MFGMGTGVTLAAKPPTKKSKLGLERSGIELSCQKWVLMAEDRHISLDWPSHSGD